ncbi:MAG: tRNA (guanosine(46)-N7)-methyltransferase TrmB [Bacilli bacterium]|nr:tRNA (guanosine(46)-N7)-methyltransferase TrmB [Bacilli bacterium]
MRQRNRKWAQPYLDANLKYMIRDFPVTENLFLDKKPIHIEIGTGKGDFIVEMAKKNPNVNFIGIEMQTSVIALAVQKAEKEGLENIKFLVMDARLLTEKFTGIRFDRIYLNFSDPWPKARHEKRRLTSPKFLLTYKTFLTGDGEIWFKTDNKGLYEYSYVTFGENRWSIIENDKDYQLSEEDAMSEYEKKFRALSQPIYRIKVKKGD